MQQPPWHIYFWSFVLFAWGLFHAVLPELVRDRELRWLQRPDAVGRLRMRGIMMALFGIAWLLFARAR